jgi:flagellar basal-body rod protein FlgB
VANTFSTIDTLSAAMTFHRERHAVLAGNVANVDTPGYRAVDLERDATSGESLPMAATQGSAEATSPTDNFVQKFDDGGALPSGDGNAVSLERELAKIDANRTRYETSGELVTRRLAMLRYAAGDGT